MLVSDLVSQCRHYISRRFVPVLPEDETFADALDVMRGKRTHLVAIETDKGLKFLWAADLLDYCLKRGPVLPWSTPLSTIAVYLDPAPTVQESADTTDLFALFEGGEEAVLIAGADIADWTGVATREENAEGFILTPPSVSECIQGHLFATPAPRDCPFDGTPIM